MNTYDVGDLVQITAVFTDSTGAKADPTAVVFKYRAYGLSVTVGLATRSSLGVYTATVPCPTIGQYAYRFEGTGAVTAAAEGIFVVSTSNFS